MPPSIERVNLYFQINFGPVTSTEFFHSHSTKHLGSSEPIVFGSRLQTPRSLGLFENEFTAEETRFVVVDQKNVDGPKELQSEVRSVFKSRSVETRKPR